MTVPDRHSLSHDEAMELAGLYVLDVLEPAEADAMAGHLATCPEPHDEVAQLGSITPALAALIEPVDAPPALKARVMAAVASQPQGSADVASVAPVARVLIPGPRRADAPVQPRSQQRSWLQWGLAAAAVLVIAALGAWNLALQSQADETQQRTALIARAISLSADPAADVARMRGTGPAQGASGFAVFPADGPGYIVLVDLPPAPAGETWQVWSMLDGQATSAGLISVGADGYAVLSGLQRLPGMDAVALTRERAGGADQPTMDPAVLGEMSA